MIRVFFYAGIRERIGTFETCIDGYSGTLMGLLKHLEERCGISPVDCSHSHSKNEDPFSSLIIMINGRHIEHVGGLDSSVSDGDVVSIFPLIGGG